MFLIEDFWLATKLWLHGYKQMYKKNLMLKTTEVGVR